MDSNLFLSLFEYRPRPNRRPLEDFVTECIAYIFQNDIAFLGIYLGFLLRRNILVDKFTIATQLPVSRGIIDVAITWIENDVRNSLFLEHKVWSSPWEYENDEGIKEDQITAYCKYQAEQTIPGVTNNYVALISNFLVPGYSKEEKMHDAYLGNFTWWDISRLLSEHIRGNNDQNQNALAKIEKEFVDFMRRKNMAGFEDFTLAELSSILFFRSYKEKLNSLVGRICETFKSKELDKYRLRKYESWRETESLRDYWGVIFHDGGKDAASTVAEEAGLWVFLGLFTNTEEDYFPKSADSNIPDIFGGIIKWFETAEEMSTVLSNLRTSQLLTGLEPQFNVSSKVGDRDSGNYIVIGKQESLLNFVQRNNHELEILALLKNVYDQLIDRKGILDKLIA